MADVLLVCSASSLIFGLKFFAECSDCNIFVFALSCVHNSNLLLHAQIEDLNYSSVCVFTVILCVEMDISLDNPGFQLDVSGQVDIHQSDVPRPASGSSSSGESSRCSCSRCHGRMSSFSFDRHLFCMKCRGAECDVNSPCDECFSWTKEEMEGYVKLRKTLSSKSKKSKNPSKSSSSPPRFNAPDVDIDS